MSLKIREPSPKHKKMKNISGRFKKQPKEILERLKLVSKVSEELGYPAYIVGGFVRDLIMGLKDFDLDIVVEGNGIHFARELSRKMAAGMVEHKRFGTATLLNPDKVKIDVVTARKERYDAAAALPKVIPAAIKDDLARRDFAINAIALNLTKNFFGDLVDFFKGREDIKNKRIRVLHDDSFIDDPTRILRAIRFEQRMAFKIEARTRKLMRRAIGQDMLEKVHKHRLRDEITLILKEQRAIGCLKRIQRLCGLNFIHPGMFISEDSFILLKKVKGLYRWFQEECSHKHKIQLWHLYLMCMFEDVDPLSLKKILSDFAFHKTERAKVFSFKADVPKVILRLKNKLLPSYVHKILAGLDYEVVLLALLKTDTARVKEKIKEYLKNYSRVQIHISGYDLKVLGVIPGPRFKEILKSLLYAKLDGKFIDKEGEMRYLKNTLLVRSPRANVQAGPAG